MSTYTDALHVLFPTPREGQLKVEGLLDQHHLALEAPTGSGKSGIAVALAAHHGGAQIVTHSNALSSQYLDDLATWAPALGLSYARLAGRKHYWCKAVDPAMANIDAKFRKAVQDNDGCFIGVGLREFEYRKSSVDGKSNEAKDADDDADEEAKGGDCDNCALKGDNSCPLWFARNQAASADIVVTNAALSAVALKMGSDPELQELAATPGAEADLPWIFKLARPVLVIDEADSCESLYRSVLVGSITISIRRMRDANGALVQPFDGKACKRASDGAMSAVAELERVADRFPKIKSWLAALEDRETGNYRTPEIDISKDRNDIPKVTLRLPNKMDKWFEKQRTVAMSATFTHMQARWLGVNVDVCHSLPGLDLSQCEVLQHTSFPAWKWAEKNPAEHQAWAKSVADVIERRFNQGATAGLFQSNADLDAVHGELLRRRIKCAIYRAGEDRESVIAAHKADPRKTVLLGCFAGAGRGMNLPGDLLEHVVVTRIPQNPPKGTDSKLAQMRWRVGSMSDVVQAAGRVARFDGDRGTVDVLGGFGSRYDVRQALADRGWPMASA